MTLADTLPADINYGGVINTLVGFNRGYAVRSYVKFLNSSTYGSFGFADDESRGVMFYSSYPTSGKLSGMARNPHPTMTYVNTYSANTNWMTLEATYASTAFYYLNNSLLYTVTTNIPNVPMYVYISSQQSPIQSDWILVRKYVNPEPSHSSWSGELLAALNSENYPGLSCDAISNSGNSIGDGIYWIDPSGGSLSDEFQAYCDMTTNGGGWTLVASVPFSVKDSDWFSYYNGHWRDVATTGNLSDLILASTGYTYKSSGWNSLTFSNIQIRDGFLSNGAGNRYWYSINDAGRGLTLNSIFNNSAETNFGVGINSANSGTYGSTNWMFYYSYINNYRGIILGKLVDSVASGQVSFGDSNAGWKYYIGLGINDSRSSTDSNGGNFPNFTGFNPPPNSFNTSNPGVTLWVRGNTPP
jgi:hypothetical protein